MQLSIFINDPKEMRLLLRNRHNNVNYMYLKNIIELFLYLPPSV